MTINYQVITDHPIAVDSRDTTHPGGTMNDNSVNLNFNRVLYELLQQMGLYGGPPYSLMDLGCSGGGLVKSLRDQGWNAIGIEGSDYSKIRKRAEWATIPDFLFTADITKPFTVVDANIFPANNCLSNYCYFDVVTAWEVMEHILEEDLPGLCKNVWNHLTPGGLWIMSVSEQEGFHHVCVHNRVWWEKQLTDAGFKLRGDLLGRFTLDDWVRGPRQNAAASFHLIVERS